MKVVFRVYGAIISIASDADDFTSCFGILDGLASIVPCI